MSPKTVNYWYIWSVFSSLIEAEAADGPLNLDANDEEAMKAAYNRYLLPVLRRLNSGDTEAIRLSFAYFLTANDFPADAIIGSTPDLSMNEPDNPRALFVWLWEVLFPGIDPSDILTGDIVECNDIQRASTISFAHMDDDSHRSGVDHGDGGGCGGS